MLSYSAAFLLSLACYLNSLSGELVHDDIFAVRDNQDLRSSTPIAQLLRDDFWGEPMHSAVSHKSYRPLTVLTFRMNYALHELQPWGYHVINVLLHGLATILFGIVCRKVVWPWRDCGWGSREGLVFTAMMLFASHPVHTEAVTGIVGRADLLSCVLFLLSLLLFHFSAAATNTSTSLSMITKLFLSLLCGGAAMLCKEHGATVLGVCMLYDILILNRDNIIRCMKARDWFSPSLRPLYLRSFLLLLTTSLLLAFRVWLLHGHLPHFSAQDNPASFAESLTTRILTYAYLYFFNAKLLVFPSTLCYDWQMGSIPLVETLFDLRNLGTLAFFIFLLSLSLASLIGQSSPKGHHRVTLLGLSFLAVPFLPASNLFLRVGFVVAERILYIPSLGYCILVAQGIHTLSWKLGAKSTACQCHIAISLTLLLVAVFSLKTVDRNRVWETRESLFKSGLSTVPGNAKVHYNYANFLKDSDRTQEAIHHYRESLRLAPDHAVSHNNLGTLLEGREAELHFREAVKHNPQHYKAFYNLARNLENQGRTKEAEGAFRSSIEIRPDYEDALMGVASLLGDTGRMVEGLQFMEKAVEVSGENPNVYNNLGAYLLRLDRSADAIAAYEKALSLDPRHTTAITSLARVYRSIGENEKAEELFKRSHSLQPDAGTLHHLASLYHNTGRISDARRTFTEALRLDPLRTESACALAQTLSLMEQYREAATVLEETIKLFTDSSATPAPCVHLNLASTYLHLKDSKKALEYSERAVELSGSNEAKSDAYHLQGGILKDLGRMEEAERLAGGLQSVPMHLMQQQPMAVDWWGVDYSWEMPLKGDIDREVQQTLVLVGGMQSYRNAVSLNPQKATSRMNLGAMLHIKKDYVGARREYESALKLDPTNELILENLKKLERLERSKASKISR